MLGILDAMVMQSLKQYIHLSHIKIFNFMTAFMGQLNVKLIYTQNLIHYPIFECMALQISILIRPMILYTYFSLSIFTWDYFPDNLAIYVNLY